MTTANTVAVVNNTFWALTLISGIVLAGITLVMLYCVVKFNRRRQPIPVNIHGHIGLEIIWTVLPTIIFMGMFYYGYEGFRRMRSVPENAMIVKVTGRMWEWSFEYENGKKTAKRMAVPRGQPVKALVTSQDVIHSFYIPALRVKEDARPRKVGYLWFQADDVGSYDILCAEYCGMNHAYMLGKLDVMAPEAFAKWVAEE